MVSYPGTGSNVLMRVFYTSISVSKNSQKNLGDSTYPIGSTISMQIMMQLLLASDGAA